MAISKIKTGSITDDAVTAAKVDDDGTGYTVGDLTSTGAITLGSGGTNWTLPTARGTDKYVLQIANATGAATWEESLTAPELASVSNMKINQYETPYSYTGTTTASSTTISSLSSDTGVLVGQYISGSGIPANTTIASITNSTTIVISNAATASASGVALSIQKTPGEKSGGSVTFTGTNFGTVIGELTVAITTSAGIVIANASYLTSLSGGTAITAEWTGQEGTYNEHLNSAHGSYIGDSGNIYFKITKSGLASNVLNSSTTLTADPTLPNSGIPTQTGGDLDTALTASSLGAYGGDVAGGGNDVNTKLLLKFDRGGGVDFEDSTNKGGDASPSHSAIATGNVTIIASPFADQKTALYFNGLSGSRDHHLSVTNSDLGDFGSNDFTIEFWINSTQTGAWRTLSKGTHAAGQWFIRGASSESEWMKFYTSGGTGFALNTGNVNYTTDGQWHHVAICRDYSEQTLIAYVDGNEKARNSVAGEAGAALVISSASANVGIGKGINDGSAEYFIGWLDEIRISDSVRYPTNNFQPPTARFSDDANTKFLLHSNLNSTSQTFTDSATPAHTIAQSGVWHQKGYLSDDTVTAPALPFTGSGKTFGSVGAFFDGSGDGIQIGSLASTDTDWDFGTGDFTIDFWQNLKSNYDRVWISRRDNSQDSIWFISALNSTTIRVSLPNPSAVRTNYDFTFSIPTNGTWHHIALVRSSAVIKLYVNGTQVGSNITQVHNMDSGNSQSGEQLQLGRALLGNNWEKVFNGYLDMVRISKGVARWTANFTPPTQIYGKLGPANPNVGTITLSATSTTAIDFSSVGTALPAGLTLAEGTDDGNTRKATITGTFTGTISSDTSTQNILIKGQDPSDATRAITFNGTTGMQITRKVAESVSPLFNVRRYVGSGVTREITGYGIQPDMVWLKGRGSISHYLFDSIRGKGVSIFPDSANVEHAYSGSHQQGMARDGWKLEGTSAGSNEANANFVAWGWKAGGVFEIATGAVGNTSNPTPRSGTQTAGSFERSVSNTTGFGMLSFTGKNDAASATVEFPHGMNATPAFIMWKGTSGAGHWRVWHQNLSANKNLRLDDNDAEFTYNSGGDNRGGIVAPTSTLIKAGGGATSSSNVCGSIEKYIVYYWKEVTGVSKFGSYTVSGGAGHTVTSIGFKPRFVMIKKYNTTGNWIIFDAAREDADAWSNYLHPNVTNAESSSSGYTVTVSDSNSGQMVIGTGNDVAQDTHSFIYAAFA